MELAGSFAGRSGSGSGGISRSGRSSRSGGGWCSGSRSAGIRRIGIRVGWVRRVSGRWYRSARIRRISGRGYRSAGIGWVSGRRHRSASISRGCGIGRGSGRSGCRSRSGWLFCLQLFNFLLDFSNLLVIGNDLLAERSEIVLGELISLKQLQSLIYQILAFLIYLRVKIPNNAMEMLDFGHTRGFL
jgi:hypothetical protein